MTSFAFDLTVTTGYTLVPVGKRGKPAKDSPRYKALGNSMCVPVLTWIGRRLLTVDELVRQRDSLAVG